jgi:hypothetical protein
MMVMVMMMVVIVVMMVMMIVMMMVTKVKYIVLICYIYMQICATNKRKKIANWQRLRNSKHQQ